MITYLEAIRSALARALADDPRVFLYGQDIGSFGGAFKATKNLAKEFPGRILDAPLSEDAIVGIAIGAAIFRLRFESDRQPCGDPVLSNGGSLSDCRAASVRRNSWERTVSQPEHGGALCPLSWSRRHDSRHG